MKKSNLSILILTLAINFISFSQEVKFTELSSITSRGECSSYVGSDGAIYKVGDKLKIGIPSSNKTFAFITEGDGFLIPITNLNVASSGQETEIKSMNIVGNKRVGYSISFRTKGLTGLSNYTIHFENAILNGEVKGLGKSSDDALAELKKAKDKLELGLITQTEYDNLKIELSKYIK